MQIRESFATALLLALITVVILFPPQGVRAAQQQPQVQQTIENVQVNISPLQYVRISIPQNSSVDVVSVTGGVYRLIVSNDNLTYQVQFQPVYSSVYNLALRVVSNGSNFVNVSRESSPHDIPVSNFSASGNILLGLTVNSTGPVQNSSNPGTSATNGVGAVLSAAHSDIVVAMVSVAGILMLTVGSKRRQEFSYLGIALLLFGGAMSLGYLATLAIALVYLAGFVVVNLAWKFHLRRMR